MMVLARRKYGSVDRLKNSEIFDLKSGTYGYHVEFCDQQSPCPPVVLLYAKMSLHRYNFVKGTKFELIGVQKYVQTSGSAAASYVQTSGLPDLEIVDVAIDAANDEEALYANNAVFYIRYRDLYKATLGEPLDRIAIVRRSFDKPTGGFRLVGQTMSSDVIPNNRTIANEEDTGCSSFMGLSTELPTQLSSPLGASEDHEAANQLAMMNLRYEEAAGGSMELDSPSALDN